MRNIDISGVVLCSQVEEYDVSYEFTACIVSVDEVVEVPDMMETDVCLKICYTPEFTVSHLERR